MVWTQKQCDDRFASHVGEFAANVAKAIGGAATTQHQFDAMASLAYNIGMGNFSASTLLRKHKAGDFAGAAAQFARLEQGQQEGDGRPDRRRAAEAALYNS